MDELGQSLFHTIPCFNPMNVDSGYEYSYANNTNVFISDVIQVVISKHHIIFRRGLMCIILARSLERSLRHIGGHSE